MTTNLKRQLDACVGCSKRRIPFVKACEACSSEIGEYLHTSVMARLWTCTVCAVEQASGSLCYTSRQCIHYQLASHGAKLSFLQQFDPSPLSNDFTGDVSFRVKDSEQCIQAHRFVLVSRSPVFKAMMENDMREKITGTIHIEDMSAAVPRAALNFMYTGEIKFSGEVCAKDVYKFAHHYEIQSLKDVCESKLATNLNSGNLLEILSIAHRFNIETLKEMAMQYFSAHQEVRQTTLDSLLNSYNEVKEADL